MRVRHRTSTAPIMQQQHQHSVLTHPNAPFPMMSSCWYCPCSCVLGLGAGVLMGNSLRTALRCDRENSPLRTVGEPLLLLVLLLLEVVAPLPLLTFRLCGASEASCPCCSLPVAGITAASELERPPPPPLCGLSSSCEALLTPSDKCCLAAPPAAAAGSDAGRYRELRCTTAAAAERPLLRWWLVLVLLLTAAARDEVCVLAAAFHGCCLLALSHLGDMSPCVANTASTK